MLVEKLPPLGSGAPPILLVGASGSVVGPHAQRRRIRLEMPLTNSEMVASQKWSRGQPLSVVAEAKATLTLSCF
jgi:hypothetical protein